MSEPLDLDEMLEALDYWRRIGDWGGEFVESVFVAVLEAPTADWCDVHDAQKERDLPNGKWCDWADGDEPCRFGRVRLVAESETE